MSKANKSAPAVVLVPASEASALTTDAAVSAAAETANSSPNIEDKAMAPAADSAAASAPAAAGLKSEPMVSARVLCAVTIGADGYLPNDVIEGLPSSIADHYAGSIDSHPDAVDHALAQGAVIKQFVAAE